MGFRRGGCEDEWAKLSIVEAAGTEGFRGFRECGPCVPQDSQTRPHDAGPDGLFGSVDSFG